MAGVANEIVSRELKNNNYQPLVTPLLCEQFIRSFKTILMVENALHYILSKSIDTEIHPASKG